MNRIEIDVTKSIQVSRATNFIKKNHCAAIVVSPELVTDANISRSMARSKHKIITTIDWPKGNSRLNDKFIGIPSEAIQAADGFEVLLTADNRMFMVKEARFMSTFFRDHFPPTVELRFVLGLFAPDRGMAASKLMVEAIKEAIQTVPSPTMIRTTHLTKLNSQDGSVASHLKTLEMIDDIRHFPTKLSGNIGLHARVQCKSASIFACTFEQAQSLQRDLSDDAIKKLKQVADEPSKEAEEAAKET